MKAKDSSDAAMDVVRQVETILAEKEIYRILCSYCEAIDTADLATLSSLWEHGQWAFVAQPGGEPVRSWFIENVMLEDGVPGCSHQLANTIIDVDLDAGTAVAKTYISAFQAARDFPLQTIFCGRFNCTFEKLGSTWWWKSQSVEPDLIGDLTRHRVGLGAGENPI